MEMRFIVAALELLLLLLLPFDLQEFRFSFSFNQKLYALCVRFPNGSASFTLSRFSSIIFSFLLSVNFCEHNGCILLLFGPKT